VHSAIVHIVPNPDKRARVADPAAFHQFVRSLFLHRRKFLRGVLIGLLDGQLNKQDVDQLLAAFSFPADVRAEQLPVEALIALDSAIRACRPASTAALAPGIADR
jgi:16S rRNA (adenine1518-N6/adenine1519-N6)-dimethyltransferase